MAKNISILERWNLTVDELTQLIDANPSLRGILLGYAAEQKLTDMWFRGKITCDRKHDDHDRKGKGDHIIRYRGERFIVECKSLQTATVRKVDNTWTGKAQVDASDRREVTFHDGTKLNTTCLLRGEFDLLAVNCFAFANDWRFVFARNADLPTSEYSRYTEAQRSQLLKSLVTVTWPAQPPFQAEPFGLLDQIIEERRKHPTTGRGR